MIGVVLNAIEHRFIELLTDVRECQVRWMPAAKPNRTMEKSLQPVPIISAGKTPPTRPARHNLALATTVALKTA